MDNFLKLFFADSQSPQLTHTIFSHGIVGEPILAWRGRALGVYESNRTFQWTAGVQAFCILCLKGAICCKGGDRSRLILSGGARTPAASLDYAISKKTNWLIDMLGTDSRGAPVSNRLIRRSNPERKRPGPVQLCLNSDFLPLSNIHVYLDEYEVTALETISWMLSNLSGVSDNTSPDKEEYLVRPIPFFGQLALSSY